MSAMSTYNASNGNNKKPTNPQGRLRMTILSAYDLPDREPPLYVQLDITSPANTNTTNNGTTSTTTTICSTHTGPPVQRHKDRNSFKFHSHKANITSNGQLTVETATLQELYQATARLTVVYASSAGSGSAALPQQQRQRPSYSATYPLHQLLIHETTWLILNLQTPQEQQQAATAETNEAAATAPEQTAPPATPSTTRQSQQQAQPQQPTPLSIGTTSGSMDDMEDVPPTLRLQMTLEGPYRTEIAALVNFVRAWLALVEDAETKFQQHITPFLPSMHQLQWLLIPTAPIVALAVVSTPIVVGFTLVTLPLVLPLFLIACVVGGAGLILGGTLYASTTAGRAQVAAWVSPAQHALLHTQTGQAWVYQTGPRPTPVNLCRTLFPTGLWGKLLLSLWIDFMGSATYLLPVLGEALDVFWAPLQTTFIMALYCPPSTLTSSSSLESDDTMSTVSGSSGGLGSTVLPYVSFMEEILPLTDIVPTATLGWLGEFAWPFLIEQVLLKKNDSDGPKPSVPGSSLRDSLLAHQQ